ncbi:MAG TPA: hypothetical protein VGQ33_23520, partial [Vicinamibacteria bacterium]|nr:hypothetical protein [Vicinamibacteria bacterium]
MRVLAALLLLFLPPALAAPAVPAATPGTSLGALAEGVAAEIVRAAGGRAVELASFEDRTGSTPLATDLQALVRARLEGRARAAEAGPRVVIASVVAQVGGRLVWSGRAREEPSGTLLDVLSVSIPWDPAFLPLVSSRGRAETDGVDVVDHASTPPLDGRIVALAFAGDDRLLVLFEDALALYRREGLALRLESRRDLPGPLAPVRFPGGLLLAAEGESACWAWSSRSPRATLFTLDGGRLVATHQADAVPWPSLPSGVRFRPGTNLLDVEVPGVDAPVLAIDAEAGWMVDGAGALSRIGAAEPAVTRRAGPALARLWPGTIAAAAPDAPGERDRILVMRAADGTVTG